MRKVIKTILLTVTILMLTQNIILADISPSKYYTENGEPVLRKVFEDAYGKEGVVIPSINSDAAWECIEKHWKEYKAGDRNTGREILKQTKISSSEKMNSGIYHVLKDDVGVYLRGNIKEELNDYYEPKITSMTYALVATLNEGVQIELINDYCYEATYTEKGGWFQKDRTYPLELVPVSMIFDGIPFTGYVERGQIAQVKAFDELNDISETIGVKANVEIKSGTELYYYDGYDGMKKKDEVIAEDYTYEIGNKVLINEGKQRGQEYIAIELEDGLAYILLSDVAKVEEIAAEPAESIGLIGGKSITLEDEYLADGSDQGLTMYAAGGSYEAWNLEVLDYEAGEAIWKQTYITPGTELNVTGLYKIDGVDYYRVSR